MTTVREANLPTAIETVLRALEAADAVAAASAYTEEAVFVDPRYPDSQYRGREAIREAFEWGLTNGLHGPEYAIRHHSRAGGTAVVEGDVVDTGTEEEGAAFPRVFVVELGEAGITHWRSYLPFPPC